MNQLPENSWREMHAQMVRKLTGWEMSHRARLVGLEIAGLSFAAGRPEVELYAEEIAGLTGYDEAAVSRAVAELMRLGVLQRYGPRGGSRIYRLLPNAEMVPPPLLVNSREARRIREEVRRRNALRQAGDEAALPGQAALLRPVEERLRMDQAEASAELAREEWMLEEQDFQESDAAGMAYPSAAADDGTRGRDGAADAASEPDARALPGRPWNRGARVRSGSGCR